MIPIPYQIVGLAVFWVIVLVVIGAAEDGLRERRRSRARPPVPCRPDITLADIEQAIRQGCCVTADAVPPDMIDQEPTHYYADACDERCRHETPEGARFHREVAREMWEGAVA